MWEIKSVWQREVKRGSRSTGLSQWVAVLSKASLIEVHTLSNSDEVLTEEEATGRAVAACAARNEVAPRVGIDDLIASLEASIAELSGGKVREGALGA